MEERSKNAWERRLENDSLADHELDAKAAHKDAPLDLTNDKTFHVTLGALWIVGLVLISGRNSAGGWAAVPFDAVLWVVWTAAVTAVVYANHTRFGK